MRSKVVVLVSTLLIISLTVASSSYAAEKESFAVKVKNFWKTLLSYPARVTEESASVLADTVKGGAGVITNEIKRASEIATGDVAKTKEFITEPITGTVETVMKTTEGIIKIPSEAAKEKTDTPAAESK